MSGDAFRRAHDEAEASLASYALGALSDDEAARVEGHLAECDRCRDDLAALRVAVDMLPTAAPPRKAPPELKERVMGVVRAEAELLEAAGEEADRPPARSRRSWFGSLLPRPAVAAAAAGALVLAAIAGFVIGGGTGGGTSTRTVQAQVAPMSGVSASTSAAVHVRNERATLVVRDMPEPPAEKVYEVWVKHGAAAPVPAGTTFVVRSGDIPIPHSVGHGDRVLVTAEPKGGSLTPTSTPMIVARPA